MIMMFDPEGAVLSKISDDHYQIDTPDGTTNIRGPFALRLAAQALGVDAKAIEAGFADQVGEDE